MLDGINASESTKAMFLTESINDTRKLIKNLVETRRLSCHSQASEIFINVYF